MGLKEIYQKKESSVPEVKKENYEKQIVEKEYTLDTALDVKNKKWRKLYYDIIAHPSPPGLYELSIDGDTWDLKRFEDYIARTFTLIYLPAVLDYKGARIKSFKKDYVKFETERGK